MELFKRRYVHRIRSRTGDFIFYYRRPPSYRVPIGRSSQELHILEAAYVDAEQTYLQFFCQQRLPHKKDVVGRMMRGAYERAARYGREMTISAPYVRSLLVQQKFRCALTGIPFSMLKPDASTMRPFGPSIDRIDNSQGYVPGNIRILCNIANFARNAFSDDDFYKMCVAASALVENTSRTAKGGNQDPEWRQDTLTD